MHVFLVRACALAATPSAPGGETVERAILGCVARGGPAEAEAVLLGELHRAGWRVREVLPPAEVRRRLPDLKRLPGAARTLEAARGRGLALLVLDLKVAPV